MRTVLRVIGWLHRVKQRIVVARLWRAHTARTGRQKPEWWR